MGSEKAANLITTLIPTIGTWGSLDQDRNSGTLLPDLSKAFDYVLQKMTNC